MSNIVEGKTLDAKLIICLIIWTGTRSFLRSTHFFFAFVKFEDFRFLGLYAHTCIYVYVYADFKFWYIFVIRKNCLKYQYLLSVLIGNRSIIKKGFLQLSFIENVRLNPRCFWRDQQRTTLFIDYFWILTASTMPGKKSFAYFFT